MIPSLAFVDGLVVDFRRSKFHVGDPIFDLVVAISISSSRRIFMAKSCQEWCVDF